jgi:N-methylhydantoinase A/oxoprolinase/acetone carboxylase beta subunit
LRTAKPETEVTVDLLDPSLVDRYRAWSSTPVREAIAAWDGKAKTVQNSALALAALVLVVTASDEGRAMKLSKDLSPDAARKLKKLVLDFTKAIGKKSKLKEEVWGFPLSIASKHFFGLRREGGRVWFDANRVDETIDMYAAELRRRRRPVDPDQAIAAFEALAEGYEVASKTLDCPDLPRIDRVATDALIGKLRKALEHRAQS